MGNVSVFKDWYVHTVEMSSFYMADKEVTNAQFEKFEPHKRGECTPSDDHPVANVTRAQVLAFAKWLGKKDGRKYGLPTEAQWEYGARGGIEGADYPWGDGLDESKALIGGRLAKPVGSYPPNQYGLYDMCGNVGEMVHEAMYEYPNKAVIDPKYPDAGDMHIIRGRGVGDYMPWIWFRDEDFDDTPYPETGFRLVILTN